MSTIQGNVKRSLDGIYPASASHFAARCLAEFQYRFNRRYEVAAPTRRLLREAAMALPRPILISFA